MTDARRAALVALLAAHQPSDAKEQSDLAAMRDFALTLAQPFSAEQPEAHFTASALVVDPGLSRVCLVRHRKLDRWLQPGGHVEPEDASLLGAAQREVAEETSLRTTPSNEGLLDVDVHTFPARNGRPPHLHLDCRFLLVANHGDALSSSGESLDVRWFEPAEANAVADAGLRRMIAKAALRE
jgi:8-oxo-dGTP pyrophosphatase MutT (NUDIX family)